MVKLINLYFLLFICSIMSAQTKNVNMYKPLSRAEINQINEKRSHEVFRVLLTTSDEDTKVLRSKSIDIDPKDSNIKLLADRMYATVQDELSKGVGIAAPQIGINRNVFWVQRFDKEGSPFEFIINPEIIWYSNIVRKGREGCLSIPDIIGMVHRSLAIRVKYYDIEGNYHDEVVEGFTAVIFQHEYDHLKGVLFTDRLKEQEKLNYINADEVNNLFYLENTNIEKFRK